MWGVLFVLTLLFWVFVDFLVFVDFVVFVDLCVVVEFGCFKALVPLQPQNVKGGLEIVRKSRGGCVWCASGVRLVCVWCASGNVCFC